MTHSIDSLAGAAHKSAADLRLRQLEGAHRVVLREVSDLRLALQRLTSADALRRVSRLTNQRAKAAEALQAAIAETVKAWKSLYETTEKIRAAYPSGILPAGSLANRGPLFRALELEFWKQSGVPFSGAGEVRGVPALPGAKCRDVRLEGNPDALPSIVDAVNGGNSVLLAHLSGEPRPASAPEPVAIAGEVGAIDDDGLGEIVPPKPAPPKTHTAESIQATIKPRKLAI